ncbi:amidohydrolase [Specibacter cremeus]|uniref:amidohydrolase n=1 Tax=Specibacter cremeus TaxID=1629051 RepID=UPI001F0C80E8|nr:amidohydrolase family protein [Specibacter cremeus]
MLQQVAPDHTRALPDRPADLVVRGGPILTLDGDDRVVEGLAAHDGRITCLGAGAEALIGPDTRVIDLAGRAALPGINDSHLHGAWLGALWPNTMFGSDLAPEEAHGPLVTNAAERRAAILKAGRLIASLGITSYTEPGLGPGEDAGPTGCFGEDVLREYLALDAEGLLTARVNVLLLFGLLDGGSTVDDLAAGLARIDTRTPNPETLRIAGVKVFADGIPPMHSAWIHGHYPDGSQGAPFTGGTDAADGEESLRRMITLVHERGLQVGVHATGDRSIDVTVDTVASLAAAGQAPLRHYIIHGDLATPETLARMAPLGMGLNVQGGIAHHTAAWVAGVLGEKTAAEAWPLQAALDAGVPLALSSDAPVTVPDWRVGLAAANEWMGPAADARTRMRDLLRAYTVTPAWQDGAEGWKGSLRVGHVADLAVLGANPFDLSPADLPGVPVDYTVLGGKVVYERTGD